MPDKDVIIIGGGISGLSALHFLRQLHPDLSVTLYEADNRLGGTIGTDHVDGYSLDWGPNGFLDREPLTLRLVDELGLKDVMEPANANVSNRFILRGNRLRSVPMSPPKFLASDILSVKGRLRVMWEPFASGPTDGVDESIYDFGRRRIGTEAADYLIQPMVSGVYGGVAQRLSLKSCFPIMDQMEREYGSLVKAMIAKARKAKAEGKKSGGPGGPGGWLTSFNGGLYPLVEQHANLYADHIVTQSPIESITKDAQGYTIKTKGGTVDTTRILILALPTNNAAEITGQLSAKLAEAFNAIPYAPISVVCLGYSEKAVRTRLDGFGFLVPQKENRRLLGSIWTSSIFDARAPEGKVQFRSMIGGDGDHESMDLSDDELVAIVKRELDEILGIDGDPELVKLYRWKYGIPQFRIGHSKILDKIESELTTLGNIYVTGNAYHGIGLNDCIKQSYKVVNSLKA